MKIALGMIVPYFKAGKKLMGFIENAQKYGHELDHVIVSYSKEYNEAAGEWIRSKANLHMIDIKNPEYCRAEMQKRDISETSIKTLLECPIPIDMKKGLVPYGHNRTAVVMEAMLRGADILIFIDSDVTASVLIRTPNGSELKEIDFFGEHLKHLRNNIDVTTGEYSGYNILPPASFDGMDDLLYGVKKGDMIKYWQNSAEHKCLVYQPDEIVAQICKKILGGNLGLKLSAFAKLPPFFSSYYISEGETFLCRGEDTVLGFGISALGTKCMDIGLYPLHDTYADFPAVPDLKKDRSVQERFFYACTGWVGRNPFFNHILGKDPKTTMEYQREHLVRGIPALVKYTGNPIYERVLTCFDTSWNSLNRYVDEFERVSEAWNEFKSSTM